MYGGGRRGIPCEEDEGGGRDNDNKNNKDNMDGRDDTGVGDLSLPGGI